MKWRYYICQKIKDLRPVLINGKNYEVIKVGDPLIKRRYNISDNIGYTVLKIKFSNGSNILNSFNQLNLNNIESIKIINKCKYKTTLPNLNVDSESTNQHTIWTLINGTYKMFYNLRAVEMVYLQEFNINLIIRYYLKT